MNEVVNYLKININYLQKMSKEITNQEGNDEIMKTISEIKKTAIKKDFIVDNLMKSNGLYCLVARPKVGKSLLTLQLPTPLLMEQHFQDLILIPHLSYILAQK